MKNISHINHWHLSNASACAACKPFLQWKHVGPIWQQQSVHGRASCPGRTARRSSHRDDVWAPPWLMDKRGGAAFLLPAALRSVLHLLLRGLKLAEVWCGGSADSKPAVVVSGLLDDNGKYSQSFVLLPVPHSVQSHHHVIWGWERYNNRDSLMC